MIILHFVKNDKVSLELKARLDKLSLRYKLIEHKEEDCEGAFIEEDDLIIEGEQELVSWLSELEQELKWQRSISGDGCYIDPNSGDVC